MSRHVALLSLTLACLASALVVAQATTLTGTWNGWLVVKHADKAEEHYVHVVLKHTGETLTGTAGPTEDEQLKILKGKVVDDKGVTTVTFEFIANSVHTAFTLKLVDGVLKGDARIEGEDGQVHKAAVELRR